MYHCVLQLHSILSTKVIPFCLVTTPTSFIGCKARLVSHVLSFMCLHNIYMTVVITNNEIIAVTNIKYLLYDC